MGGDLTRRRLRQAGWYVLLTALALVVLFPLYMAAVRAVSPPPAYVQAGQPPYPVDPQWDIGATAFRQGNLGPKILLSATVTFIIVSAQLVTSILAAYAFSFLEFPGRKAIFAVFMATLLLPIVGALFVVETLSVIIQVVSFRGFGGRRVFRMAPIHHHYELGGWPETTVIVRFWIIAGLATALALGLFYADFTTLPGARDL